MLRVAMILALMLAATTIAPRIASAAAPPADDVLTPLQQRQVEASVDRALEWLSVQQTADGSFMSLDPAQPAVTGFCTLAFLSRGHLPNQGPYGEKIAR